jgi:hypothetical protein
MHRFTRVVIQITNTWSLLAVCAEKSALGEPTGTDNSAQMPDKSAGFNTDDQSLLEEQGEQQSGKHPC